MNILLVEDNEDYLFIFLQQLKQLGAVYTFKSSNQARRFIKTTNIQIDLVVCDHYILRFEHETMMGKGTEVYYEIRFSDDYLKTIPFVHFSSEPCNELYEKSDVDKNFYTLKKTNSTNLVDFIQKNVLK